MADYTTLQHVEALLPESVPTDSDAMDPTRAEIIVWIAQVTSQVNDAIVAGGLTAPATGADTLGALDILCAREVAYQIYLVKGYSENAQNRPLWKTWHDEFIAKLAILSGSGISADARSTIPPSSYTMNSPTDTDVSLKPIFSRERRY